MLEYLFGAKHVETALLFVEVNGQCYAKQLADRFRVPLYGVQRVLMRLEMGGILVSFLVGKTRLFEFNPRYPFLGELRAFLRKVYLYLPPDSRATFVPTDNAHRPRSQAKSPPSPSP